MKRKVISSLSIFIFLFVGALFLSEQMKRTYIKFVIKDTEPIVEYIVTPKEVEAEEVKEEDIWKFKTREYIQIRKRRN